MDVEFSSWLADEDNEGGVNHAIKSLQFLYPEITYGNHMV